MVDVVVGIDASTTGTKAIAFDAYGSERAVGRATISRYSPQPLWQEQHAEDWWESTAAAIRDVVDQCARAGDQIQALGITHQRETFVLLDADFQQVRPAMLWLDARAGEQVARIGGVRVHDLSGKPPSTTPSLYKLAWLAEHEPESIARTRYVADVHGYLCARLTGRFATSTASADPMALLDMSTNDWSAELVRLGGIAPTHLAELEPPGSLIGTVSAAAAQRTGLVEGVPVYAGAGDGQSGGLGAGVSRSGIGYLSLGTSITLGAHVDGHAPADPAYRVMGSPLGHGNTIEGFVAAGALSVGWFREAFTDAVEPAALEESLHHTQPGAGGLRFLPHLNGAATPYWDERSRGAFIGIDESHGAPQFYRAVLEGLSFETNVLLEGIEATAGGVNEIVVMGGGSNSAGWTTILANVLNRPITQAGTAEAAALGAAILAAHGCGLGRGDVAATTQAMVHNGETVRPDPAVAAIYARAKQSYRAIYPALKELYAAGLGAR
ncbi:MAG: xylulokinase [Beutenbergiaceae bacterium]